jgi:hypothetical protein
VHVHDGKVDLIGVEDSVRKATERAIAQAQDTIAADKTLSPKDRAKLETLIAQMRVTLQRMARASIRASMDQSSDSVVDFKRLGKELGDLGKELGDELRDHYSRASSLHVEVDDDDEDALGDAPDMDDADELDDAVRDLRDLKLAPEQHAKLVQLRADSDRRAAVAKAALHAASKKLHEQISNDACDDDIAKSIDAVSRQEAELRKARILAWTGARRLLNDAQRKRVEAVASKRSN